MLGMKPHFKKNIKNIKIISVLLLVFLGLIFFILLRDKDILITHTQANVLYSEDKIIKLMLDGEYIRIKTNGMGYKIYKDAINKKAFFEKYPIEVVRQNNAVFELFSLFFVFLAFILFYRFLQQNRLQQLKYFRSSTPANEPLDTQPIEALTSTVTFDDVAGITDVKEELEEIIDFLKEPKKYRNLDIRLPKGVLLVGPPGVGKTLISKAVAGEANVPFFYQSGASFVHIYVGMGAKRVSELFKKAKQTAPSIIFIDEIDAVGKSRGEFRNDEREATLNQLLTEMDGFEDSSGIIVIGATNKIEMLDEALLRSGRFDRRIHIALPDLEDRVKTLEMYLTNKPHEVDIKYIARMTVGFNFAALDTLTNEAAIYAMRLNRQRIETSDFEAVKDKVLMGKRKLLSFSEEERNIQAVYQGAKALIATWLDVDFDKIGIVNTQLLMKEHEILSKSQLLARAKVYLCGSIATKKRYNEQFTNAVFDIAQAKEIVSKVIYEYAMGETLMLNSQEEERLLSTLVSDLESLLETLDVALSEISEYLLTHENITADTCRDILRKIF